MKTREIIKTISIVLATCAIGVCIALILLQF